MSDPDDIRCPACGVSSPAEDWVVNDDATDELHNSMHGDVGFIASCPECGEEVGVT